MIHDSPVAVQNATKVKVATLADVEAAGCLVRPAGGHSVALFRHGAAVYAVDNRCPHMGFPLDRGTVCDGVLTCHWHHARFDLATGGTFDQWADDAQTFPVELIGGDIWVDVARARDTRAHQRDRLRDGLERNIPLVIAKATLSLLSGGGDTAEPLRIGLDFGVRHRQAGWGQGLTMHACFVNLLPYLDAADRPRALYHGLSAVAWDSHRAAPRFPIRPLPDAGHDLATLKRWFRRFVDVRDAEGAERCIASAVRGGAGLAAMMDMLLSAATDHRYIQTGHVADFTNKAFEALGVAGWDYAEPVLASLAPIYATAERMEESNAWRSPVDLVALLERAFEGIPPALAAGMQRRAGEAPSDWRSLVPILLGDDPQAILDALLGALRDGVGQAEVAGAVAYTAALRIAQFHTGNEFDDWVSAMHSFSFANAVHQAISRTPSAELMRGVFDAAMTIYLNRFLNVPAARLAEGNKPVSRPPDALLEDLIALLNNRQQINQAGELVADYVSAGGPPERLLAVMGHALAREDRDFHSIQMIEAAFRQYGFLRGTPEGSHVLVAAARYLAAHSPTVRAQEQTYRIAARLHSGERVFEDPSGV